MSPATRTRLQPEARKRQILAAAGPVFGGRAVSEVSLDDVAAACGVARGLINHHFGSKRGLYLEVVRETLRGPELPAPQAAPGKTVRQRFDDTVSAWLDVIERNPAIWLAAARLQAAGDPEVAEIVGNVREDMLRRTTDLLEAGPLEALSSQQRALIEMYRSVSEEAIHQWVEHGRISRGQVHSLIVELGVRAADGLLADFTDVLGTTTGDNR